MDEEGGDEWCLRAIWVRWVWVLGVEGKKKEIRNKKLKITWTLVNIWPSAQVWVPQTVENIEWWEAENMCQMGGV